MRSPRASGRGHLTVFFVLLLSLLLLQHGTVVVSVNGASADDTDSLDAAEALAEGEYFRPSDTEASGHVKGNTARFRRSPCPAINALANHGYIARDGIDISARALRDAVITHWNLDDAYAQVLVDLLNTTVFSLNELGAHGKLEHDMSLVRKDAFFEQDPAHLDDALVKDMRFHVGASRQLTPLFFAQARQRRLNDCRAQNPECDDGNNYLMGIAMGWLGLLMRAMGGHNTNAIDADDMLSFLVDERFPDAFAASSTAITQTLVQDTRRVVYALMSSSADWLGHGFASEPSLLRSEADASLCLGIRDASTQERALLYAAPCDASDEAQQFTMDVKHRLVVQHTGMCLDVFGKSVNASADVMQLKCNDETNQKWIYDASGRLHALHAPEMCLDYTLAKSKGSAQVLQQECSTTRLSQRVYSIYSDFQPVSKHVSSIAAPTLCLDAEAEATNGARTIAATLCDPQKDAQAISVGLDRQILFDASQKVLTASTNGTIQVTAASAATGSTTTITQQWHYDSLGRLHPAIDGATECLTMAATADAAAAIRSSSVADGAAITLSDCVDAQEQKWFAVDRNDDDAQSLATYYRPTASESSGILDTEARYSRSPCPLVNALANHGLIARDGRDIHVQDLVEASVQAFHLDKALVQTWLSGMDENVAFNLDALSQQGHGIASLVHALPHSSGDDDTEVDPAAMDDSRIDALFAQVGSTALVDGVFLSRAVLQAQDACGASCSSEPDTQVYLLRKMALLLLLAAPTNEDHGTDVAMGAITAKTARALLADEEIPDEFVVPPNPITAEAVEAKMVQMRALIASNADWLLHGFAPTKAPLFSVVSGSELCVTVSKSEERAPFTLRPCESTSKPPATQQLTYDASQRLVVASTGMCADVFGNKQADGSAVVQVPCNTQANQQWLIDASGRLHPRHAPRLCLSGDPEDASLLVVSTCSSSAQQIFYSEFAGFQCENQQLARADASAQSLSECLEVKDDQSALIPASCDASRAQQQFSWSNPDQTLVVEDSGTCVAPTKDKVTANGDCSSGGDHKMVYDSMGRLHAQHARSQCLSMDGDTGTAVLAVCDGQQAQQWTAITSTTTDSLEIGASPGTGAAASLARAHGVLSLLIVLGSLWAL